MKPQGAKRPASSDIRNSLPVERKQMKLMIAGGGTGGHLFPGIALAGAWKERVPHGEVFFVGTERGLENKIVPREGYRLELIDQVGLKRTGLWQLLKGLFMLPRSIMQSLRLVKREQPAVAIGVGGYASGPAILAAWLSGVPTLILEPNAMPGLTNKLLAKLAKKAISPYERARAYFGSNFVQAGIPVRPQIASALSADHAHSKPSVLVFGGSQGARAINNVVVEAAPGWVKRGWSVVHQVGAADFPALSQKYAGSGVDVREFIVDMAAAYQAADVVVCRAGASSLAELALIGKPSILVPLPTATDDHQTKNAQAFAEAGAGVLLPQSELTAEKLTALLEQILAKPDEMAAKARLLGDPQAAQNLCELCLSMVKR